MREENVAVPLTELLKGFLQGIVFKQREWRGCIPSRIDHGIQDGNNIIRVRWKLHFPAFVAGAQIGRFFAVDRYASYKTDWGRFYEEGGVVIADRYTTSNAVHQCSKLPPEQWEAFLHWLFDYEFHLLGLPAPDSVIYLQVDPAVSQRLMTARYHGDESKKDVHEKDTEYLARSRRAAEYCAEHLGWTTVHCTHSDAMRSIEDIQAEVQGIVLGQLK